MKENDFLLGPVDTDSISFFKRDQTPFTPEEQQALLDEANSLFPELIKFAHDGYFETVIAFKAKNYVTYDGKKTKLKGSGLLDGKREVAIKEFQRELIDAIIHNNKQLTPIYKKYVKEALNVQDIKRWSSRKTLTSKTFSSERANETKIVDALGDESEYVEGDRVWVFFLEDGSLQLSERFDGNYDKMVMVKKLFAATKLFNNILPKTLFINYSLKKNQKLLEEL